MDLYNFENSVFFQKGRRFVKRDSANDNWIISKEQPWCQFILNYNIKNSNIESILDILELDDNTKMRYDFYHMLITSKFNRQIKIWLLNQFLEVKNIIESLDVLPYNSFMAVIPPNIFVPPHLHHAYTKQTTTFLYTHNTLEKGSYLDVGGNKYDIPLTTNKFILHMYDNPMHSYLNTGWSFIYVHDYGNKVKMPDLVEKNFTLIC